MKSNLNHIQPEALNTPAPRHDAHARLIAYRRDVFALAQQRLAETLAAANAASAEVQKHEAAIATARAHLDATIAGNNREAFRTAKADIEFDEMQLASLRQRADSAHATYARAAAEFKSGPAVEVRNLLASALVAEAPLIAAELDAALREYIVPKLQLLAALGDYFIREKLPGDGVGIFRGVCRQAERFVADVNNDAPSPAAEGELAALVETLNH